MKLIPVDPADIPNFRESHRGRVSYPILKSFLEMNVPITKLDRTGMQQSLQALSSSLNAYIRSHKLPIKMFTRMGEIYLARLDMDDDGNLIDDWQQNSSPEVQSLQRAEPTPINPTEVARRFAEEKDKVTK